MIPADQVLLFEASGMVVAGLVLLFSFAIPRRWARLALLVVVLVIVAVVSFRPVDYNSDTWNYYNYIQAIGDENFRSALLLTKFEPLHLALALPVEQLSSWLMLEAVVCVVLLTVIFRHVSRLESLAVVCGCAIPLMSSSVRFAIGLLAMAAALVYFRESRAKSALVSAVGGLTHVSLVATGFLRKRRGWLVVFVLLAFAVAASRNSLILERAGVNDANGHFAGVRTAAVTLALMMYMGVMSVRYRRNQVRHDVIAVGLVFVATAFFFPTLNRWLLVLLIVIAIDGDELLAEGRVGRAYEAIAATALFLLLAAPAYYGMFRLHASGDW